MKIINPATLEVIKEVTEDSKSSIESKYKKAKLAQEQWSKKSLEERLSYIRTFYELLDKNREELARTLTLEVGKPINESINEINGARKRILFFLENSSKWLTTQVQNDDGSTKDSLAFDPLGVVCNISAWNYPYLVGVNAFIPALIAGNVVLYKPSEFSTLTGVHIAQLMSSAGISSDIFSLVIGARAAGEALLELPCDGYFFTGSYKTGKYISEKVSGRMVPVGLELGGKDPLYVTEDIVNISQVAGAVAEGCFYNNGQSCCAVERVYVHEKIYEDFLEKFMIEVDKLKVGDPKDPHTMQGAITRPDHLPFLDSQVKDALAKGAKVLIGGQKVTTNGSFFPPTVLVNVNHQMSLMKEESFGPIRGIMKVKDDQEAIKLMNDTEYGLTASVYSKNIERAKNILSQVNTGTSYVNCCDRVSPYLPWSGRGHSGQGSTLSFLGILAFTKPRGWHVRT